MGVPSFRIALVSAALCVASPLSAQCERSKVVASDAAVGDDLGVGVAVDGDWALVARPRFDGAAGNGTGGALVLRREPGISSLPGDDVWVEHQFLETADVDAGDNSGSQVGVSGDWAVFTSSLYDGSGDNAGAAWVYRRDDAGSPGDLTDDVWTPHQRLERAGAAADDRFGFGLAVRGDTIAVGAPRADTTADGAGAVTVFRRDDAGTPGALHDDLWTQVQELVPADAGEQYRFGWTVDLTAGTMVATVVGDGGLFLATATYVFELDDGGTPTVTDDQWVEVQKIVVTGTAVAVDGPWLCVGDPLGEDLRIYRREDPNGTPDEPLDDLWTSDQAVFGGYPDSAGFSVTLSGRMLVVGAPEAGSGPGNGDERGVVVVFRRDLGATPALADDHWRQTRLIFAQDAAPDARFGQAVALDGETLIVGAHRDSEGADAAGAAYSFRLAPLCSTTDELSLSAGGTLELQLEPWIESPFLVSQGAYWIFGSVTGSSPGIDFGGGVELPLVFDAYTKVTIKKAFSPLFTSFVDDFSPANNALTSAPASFHLPPGSLPALAGLILHHAYVVSPSLGAPVEYASNAVATLLVP